MASLLTFLTHLGVAVLAGLVIGFERQWQHKSAGLRTHALVSAGSAMYVLLSVGFTEDGPGDVTRIIAQVVVGIGFLGAGVILREGGSIHGLTTAATVWCSSAIGCMAGAGWYAETTAASVVVLIINAGFKPLENWLGKRLSDKK
jgi:putative Mg2+ transporter-C (MgtC) family protein